MPNKEQLRVNAATDSDNANAAKRKAYEEELKRAEEFKRAMAKDPKRFMDSVHAIRDEKLRVEALQRIESYKSNPDLALLTEIDLSNARLTQFPKFIYEAENMEILILDGNYFSSLPQGLADLGKLKKIYWRNNDLHNAKAKIPKIEGIVKLDLSNNNLTKLPKIHRLKGLEELVLENNKFTKIPTWKVWRTRGLNELDLSKNPIVLNRRWYWLSKRIEVLRLNKCEIDELHPSFYKMTGLNELLMQVNDLKSIPEGISRLENLSKLSFYKNELKDLPSDLFDLENLEVIDLYYNELEKISPEIAQLEKLSILYLSFNNLYDIPDEIGRLKKLEELYMHHNRISELPQSIGNLDNLKVLHFQDNYVPQFPKEVLKMKNLSDLDISDTDITNIPKELGQLNLKTFYWRNLEIDISHQDFVETKNALIKLSKSGTIIVPSLELLGLSED